MVSAEIKGFQNSMLKKEEIPLNSSLEPSFSSCFDKVCYIIIQNSVLKKEEIPLNSSLEPSFSSCLY
jgi:hypothetical protein